MTVVLEAPARRSASLTTSQLETVQGVWRIAGLPPASGYAAAFVEISVATNETLAATLASVDFGDAGSVANAVDELLRSRELTFRATS
jgi:hypothetical protein